MKIVTGSRGTPHITSNDDQGRNQGMFGSGNYILDVGEKFSAERTNANTVSISDGEGMMQGVHFRVLPGTIDIVSIDNGITGYNRIDLICARYTKNESTGIEDVEWAVVKGTPSDSTPEEPEVIIGDILAGDLEADFPMFKVTLTGLTPALETIAEISGSSAEIEEDVADCVEQIGNIKTVINNIPTFSSYGEQTTLTANAWLLLDRITLDPGKYLVIYGAEFEANATGKRGICVNTNDTPDRTAVVSLAVDGETTKMNGCKMITVENTTEYLFTGYQTSGNTLYVLPYLQYIKLPTIS